MKKEELLNRRPSGNYRGTYELNEAITEMRKHMTLLYDMPEYLKARGVDCHASKVIRRFRRLVKDLTVLLEVYDEVARSVLIEGECVETLNRMITHTSQGATG